MDTFFGMQERELVKREICHSALQGCGGTDSVAVADPNPHPAKPTSASQPSFLHPQQPQKICAPP
jgi:hypothetical protein